MAVVCVQVPVAGSMTGRVVQVAPPAGGGGGPNGLVGGGGGGPNGFGGGGGTPPVCEQTPAWDQKLFVQVTWTPYADAA